MALRQIVTVGDDILRKKAREVDAITDRVRELIEDMYDTLEESGGVGLAAPQVGILKQIAVVDVDLPKVETVEVKGEEQAISDGEDEELRDSFIRHTYLLINPRIISEEGECTEEEGCLSVPGKVGVVTRPKKLSVSSMDLDGNDVQYEVEGFLARAFCHEIDHLNGILYTDIASEVRDAAPQNRDEEDE